MLAGLLKSGALDGVVDVVGAATPGTVVEAGVVAFVKMGARVVGLATATGVTIVHGQLVIVRVVAWRRRNDQLWQPLTARALLLTDLTV